MLARDLLARNAAVRPDETAYVDGERRLSWAQLSQRSGALGRSMTDLGLAPGDRTGLLADDHLEMIVHWFACLRFGFVRTGINWRYSHQEIQHVVRDSGMRLLVVQSDLLDGLHELVAELCTAGVVLIGTGPGHGLEHDLDELCENVGEVSEPPLTPEDLIALSYTSGTSGTPKGVLLTQKGGLTQLVAAPFSAGMRPEDVVLNVLPGSGFPIFIHTHALSLGAVTVLPGRYSAEATVALVERHRVSVLFCVPTQLPAIVDAVRYGTDLTTIRLLVTTGSPVAPAVVEQARDVFGECEFQNWYGSTEATGVFSMLRGADLTGDPVVDERLAASSGRPMFHVDVDIRDDVGRSLPRGATGEVCVRGDLLQGYHGNPIETARALQDGWLRTGDIGRLDEMGFIHLSDRKSFMVVSGGYNVYPAVVERVLIEHEAVREVAVVGAPHPRWGEAVVAAVVLQPGSTATSADLVDWCESRLARWEVPKHIDLVGALPVGASGKIQRREIRDRYRVAVLPWSVPS